MQQTLSANPYPAPLCDRRRIPSPLSNQPHFQPLRRFPLIDDGWETAGKRTIRLPMAASRKNSVNRRPGAVSIRDVAHRAGVSIATVSRAVNRIATVDPALSERVWKAINEVGYLPNTQARALVSGRSRMLGLIVSEITNPFFP